MWKIIKKFAPLNFKPAEFWGESVPARERRFFVKKIIRASVRKFAKAKALPKFAEELLRQRERVP